MSVQMQRTWYTSHFRLSSSIRDATSEYQVVIGIVLAVVIATGIVLAIVIVRVIKPVRTGIVVARTLVRNGRDES